MKIFATAILLSVTIAGWYLSCDGVAGAKNLLLAYYASWSAKIDPSGAFDPALANMPSDVHIVALAFVRPDAAYSKHDLAGTGLETPYGIDVLKASIRKLRLKNPQVKVVLSVGGAEYTNWEDLDARSIAELVRDLELDGIDIDFEPRSPNCRRSDGYIACDSDELLIRAVRALRAASPRPSVLSFSLVSVGAYGESAWTAAKPTNSPYFGLGLALFREAELMSDIDLISIMAYDAGPSYRPAEALAAVQHYYKGPVLIGFTPPPESWGSHWYSSDEVIAVLRDALRNGAAGGMLFAIGKQTDKAPSPATPDSTMLLETISSLLRQPHDWGSFLCPRRHHS